MLTHFGRFYGHISDIWWHISHLCCLILQHRLQLLHHKFTDGTPSRFTDMHHRLDHNKASITSRYKCTELNTTSIFYWWVSSQVPIMSYPGRFFIRRLHLSGRNKLESRDGLESRYCLGSKYGLDGRFGLGSMQFQHGNRFLHSRAEASKDTDVLGLLRTEACKYVKINRSTKVFTLHAVSIKHPNLNTIPQPYHPCNIHVSIKKKKRLHNRNSNTNPHWQTILTCAALTGTSSKIKDGAFLDDGSHVKVSKGQCGWWKTTSQHPGMFYIWQHCMLIGCEETTGSKCGSLL